jgi:hypothetical protein
VNAFGILQLPESSDHHGLKIEGISINRILDMEEILHTVIFSLFLISVQAQKKSAPFSAAVLMDTTPIYPPSNLAPRAGEPQR